MIERVEITNLQLEVGPKVFFAIAALNQTVHFFPLTFDERGNF